MLEEEPSIGVFTPARDTGEQSSLWETASAAFKEASMQGGMLLHSSEAERLYDERIDAIQNAVGTQLPNPYRSIQTSPYRNDLKGGTFGVLQEDLVPGESQLAGDADRRRDPFSYFDEEMNRLAEAHPDKAALIKGSGPVLEPLYAKMRQLEHNSQSAIERSPLTFTARIPKWVPFVGGDLPLNPAAIAGGFAGNMLTDPVQATVNIFAGPLKTVGVGARNVLWNAAKVGAANVAVEASQQPTIQDWRGRAGMQHGAELGVKSALLSGVLGSGLDAGVRGSFRGVQRARRLEPRTDAAGGVIGWQRPGSQATAVPDILDALDQAARTAPEGSTLRRAAEGDREALEAIAREAGVADSPEVRGALRAMALEDGLDHRIAGADDGEGMASLAQAIRNVTDDEEPPPRGIDPLAPERGPVLADDEITDAALIANHRAALADLEARRVDPDLQEHHRRMIARLEERVSALENMPEGRPLSKAGDTFEMDGRPVSMRSLPAASIATEPETFQFKRESASARRLAGVQQWDTAAAGRVMAYEYADGRLVIADGHQRLALAQRLGSEGREQIDLDAIVFREADGWSTDDVRALAAKKNLQEGTGSVIDAAKIQRQRPDIIDRTVPISSEAMRQSRNLARLSDDAFAMVEAGAVAANHAAVVGQLVEDRARHAEFVSALAKARPANIREARLMVGDLLQTGRQFDAQRAILGVDTISTDMLKPRAQVLDRALKLLKEDAEVFGLISAEASRIELIGNRLRTDANAERALRSEAVGAMMETLAARPGPVSEWLTEAAREVAGGTKPQAAAEAFVTTVRDALESQGLDGLRPKARPPLRGEGLDDPGGPEARAQVEDLERELAADIETAARDIANRNLDKWIWWQHVNNRDLPELTLAQRSEVVRRVAAGEEIADTFDDVVSRGEESFVADVANPEQAPGSTIELASGEIITRAEVESIVDMWSYVREMRNVRPPQSLTNWLVSRGGVQNEGTELTTIIGRPKDRPGLISRGGMTLDDAALGAWEAGFFRTGERPSINEFLAALDEDVRGNHIVRTEDEGLAEKIRIAREFENELAQIGIQNARNEADVRAQLGAEPRRDAGEGGEGADGRPADSGRTTSEDELGDFDEEAPFALAVPEAATQRRIFDDLGFYSQALEAARAWKQAKGTPDQIRQHLKNSGVRDAEIRATGLDAFLSKAGKSVGRDAVITHLEDNRVRLNEVVFDADGGFDNIALARRVAERADAFKGKQRREMLRAAKVIEDNDEFDGRKFELRFVSADHYDKITKSEEVRNEIRSLFEDLSGRPRGQGNTPKWRDYSIDVANPTYAETVVHLPRAVDVVEAEWQRVSAAIRAKHGGGHKRDELPPEDLAMLTEVESRLARASNDDYKFGHFSKEAPNPVGHIRHSIQKDAEGNPVLLIDEAQMDWAQYIRDRTREDQAQRLFGKHFEALSRAERAEVSKAIADDPSGVPLGARKDERVAAKYQDYVNVYKSAWDIRRKLEEELAGTGEVITPPFDPNLMRISEEVLMSFRSKVSAEKRRGITRLVLENNEIADKWRKAGEALQFVRQEPAGHPLVNTTAQALETLFRRAVRIAIDAGVEKIALTPGVVHALRFPDVDGSRTVTGIRYSPERGALLTKRAGGATWVQWKDAFGKPERFTPEDLPRLLGVELADKLLRQSQVSDRVRGAGWHELTKLKDAVVGGSGFRATYDQIYPKTLLKILKKIDPSVSQSAEGLFSSLDGRQFRLRNADNRQIGSPLAFHTFRLTDAVRERVVGQGLPMFALSPDLRSRFEFDQQLAARGTAQVQPDVIKATHAALAPLGTDLPEGWRVSVLKSVRPIRSSNPADAGKHVGTFELPDGSEVRLKLDWQQFSNARAAVDTNNRLLAVFRFATSDVDGRELHVAGQRAGELGQKSVILFDRSLRGEFWHELLHVRRRIAGADAVGDAFARIFSHAESLGVLDMTHREYMQTIGRPGYANALPDRPMRDVYSEHYSTRADVQDLLAEEAGAHLVELLEHGVIRVAEVEPIIDDLRRVFGRVPGDRIVERQPVSDILAPLELAQQMERHGASPQSVLRATGLQRGAGGAWQGEGRTVAPLQPEIVFGRVDHVLDRPELFEAYPALRSFDLKLELRRGEAEASVNFSKRQIEAGAETVEAALRKVADAARSHAQKSVKFTAGSTEAAVAGISRRIVDDIDEEAARVLERIGLLEGRLSSLDEILNGAHPEVSALRQRLDVLHSDRRSWSDTMLRPVRREIATPSRQLRRPRSVAPIEETASRMNRSADELWQSGASAGEIANALRAEFNVEIDGGRVARQEAWASMQERDRALEALTGEPPARAVDAADTGDPVAAMTRADIEELSPIEMAALLREGGRDGVMPERVRSVERVNRIGVLRETVEACRS